MYSLYGLVVGAMLGYAIFAVGEDVHYPRLDIAFLVFGAIIGGISGAVF